MLEGNYRKKVYSTLKKEAGLTISEEEFNKRLNSDPSYKKKVYSTLNKEMGLTISEEEFNNRLKKKESSESTSQERPSASPTKTTRPSTSSDTEPPTRAAASVSLGGPIKSATDIVLEGSRQIAQKEGEKVTPVNTFGQQEPNVFKGEYRDISTGNIKKTTPTQPQNKNLTVANDAYNYAINNLDKNKSLKRLEDEINNYQFTDGITKGLQGVYNTLVVKPLNVVNEYLGGDKEYFETSKDYKPLERETKQAIKELKEEKGLKANISQEEIFEKAKQIFLRNDEQEQLHQLIDAALPRGYDREGVWKELKLKELNSNALLKSKIASAEVFKSQLDNYNNVANAIKSGTATDEQISKFEDLKEKAIVAVDGLKYLQENFDTFLKEAKTDEEKLELFKYNYNDFEKNWNLLSASTKNIFAGSTKLLADTSIFLNESKGDYVNPVANFLSDISADVMKDAEEQSAPFYRYKAGKLNSWSDLGSFATQLAMEQVPVLASIYFGGTPGTALVSMGSGGQKIYELEEQEKQPFSKKYSDGEKLAAGWLYSGAEFIPERLGTARILKDLERTVASASTTSRKMFMDSFFKNTFKGIGKVSYYTGLEGATELMTAESQIAIDQELLDIVKTDAEKNELRAESFFSGALMGGGMAMAGGALGFAASQSRLYSEKKDIKQVREILSKIDKLNTEVENNKNLTELEKKGIYEDINQLNNKAFSIVEKNANKGINLSIEEKSFLLDVNKRQGELRDKAKEVSESNYSKEYKKEKIKELSDEFNSLEEKRNNTLSGRYSRLFSLSEKELSDVKKEATAILVSELNQTPGAEIISPTNEQIENKALEILNTKQNTAQDAQVVTEQVREEVADPLKDVESTANALNEDAVNSIEEATNILFPKNEETNNIIAEAYHQAKQDGSNPELVKAVEDILGKPAEVISETTVEVTPTTVTYNGTEYSKNDAGNWVNNKTGNEVKGIGSKGKALIATLNDMASTEATTQQQPTATEQAPKTEIEEALDDIVRPKTTNIVDQVDRAKKAISKILPGVEIVYHDTEESYSKATGEKTNGLYDPQTKKIHVNGPRANKRTVAHEVAHAVILRGLSTDKEAAVLTKRMFKALRGSLKNDPKRLKELEEFAKLYEKGERNEEKISELLGYLASEYETLPQPTKNIIQKWLEKIAMMLNMKPFTDKEVVDFMNTLAERVREGQEITEQDVKVISEKGKNISSPVSLIRNQRVGAFDVEYTEEDKLNELIKNKLVTEPDNVKFMEGKNVAITSPDDMLTGSISINGSKIFEGGGGVFFVTKYGDVWASGKIGTANTLANMINDSMDKNGGDSGFLVLTKGSDSKLISSSSGVLSSLSIIDSMLDSGLISLSDFRSAVSASVKKFGGNISLRNSAKQLKDDVQKYFSNPKESTFQKRGDVLKTILEQIAQSKSVKENKSKVIEFLGGDTSKGLVSKVTSENKSRNQSLSDLVSGIASEKLTKGLTVGDVYAIIEVKSKVKVKEDSHPSYPFHIVTEDGSKPVLHLPKNRESGSEVMTTSSGKPYSVGNVSVMSGSFNTLGTRRQILGENAKLSQDIRDNLDVARNMELLKKSDKEIRLVTGWERGADKKWRYEIPDNIPFLKDTVRIVGEFLSENKGTNQLSQKANYFLPKELLDLYPELNDVTIKFDNKGDESEGSYDTETKTIEVSIGVYPSKTVSSLIHEVQHAIQEIEGFSEGGSLSSSAKLAILSLEKKLGKRIESTTRKEMLSLKLNKEEENFRTFILNSFYKAKNQKQLLDLINKESYKVYKNLIGEVEARNVERRMNATPEARRRNTLRETEDVAREDQIIFFKERTPNVSARRQISPENSSNYANMTEDGKGNFVFFHFGPRGIKFIDPKKYGSNKGAITSKPEVAAMGRVGGMSQFYTMPEYQESNVSGDKYMIKVPMDKVYDFNTDPDNLIGKAKEMFKEKHPDLPFTANDQVAFITKLAEKAGYDMTVAEWNGMSRAQSTKPLKPVDVQVMDGNVISKPFNENYESNASKGFTSVVPTSKEAILKKVYEDINNERNSQNKYDGLYHLAEEFPKKTQEEITEMIEGSDISQGLKDAYATALAYEPGMRMSARRQVNTGAIAENTKSEVDRVKKLSLEAEDGATFNLDGTKYDKGGLIVPVTSLEPNTNQKDLSSEMVAKFTKDNESKIGDDSIVKVGIYKFPDKDTVSVDMSIVIPNKHRAVALEFGKMIGQESLYDLDANENVKTGADGMNPVNLTDEQFRVAAAALKEGQMPQITISRRQQNSAIDRAVAAAKSRGFDDKTIINYLVSRGYTSEEATRAVLKYNKSVAERIREEEGVFTRAGRRRIAIALDKFRRVTLSKRAFNTKTGLQLREFMEGNINAELREARIALEEYDKMLPKDKTQRAVIEAEADKFLKGDTSANLPLEFKAVVGRFRTHIDNLSMRLIDTGTLTQAQADKLRSNIGQYVNRSYQVFDDPKWKDKVTEEMKEAVRNELRNLYYSLRGNVPKAKKDRKTYGDKFAYKVERSLGKYGYDEDAVLNEMIEGEINKMIDPKKASGFIGQKNVASKDLSIMKQKNTAIPLSVRQLMGEYGNAGQNYAKTVQKLSALIYESEYLKNMRELGLGVFFFEKDDPNRDRKEFNTPIASEGSKVMSPLNGLYTTPEMAEMFKEDTVGDLRYLGNYFGRGFGPAIMRGFKMYFRLLGFIKKRKTAYSIGGHFKNTLGQLEYVLSNFYLNPGKYANAFMTLKNSKSGEFKKKMDEYIRLGVVSSNIETSEIKKLLNRDDFDSFLEKRLERNMLRKSVSWVDEKLTNLYQAEDDLFKIVSYEMEFDIYSKAYPNKSKEEIQRKASNNTKNIMANYNRIGQIGAVTRAAPLLTTFMSYQLESYRTAWNNIALAKEEMSSGNNVLRDAGRKRIIGALSVQVAKHFIMHSLGTVVFSPILSLLTGSDDDDDELTDYEKKVKYMNLMLPDYAKIENGENIVITREGGGEIRFINFSSSDPRKGISNTISAAIQGKDPVDGFIKGAEAIIKPFVSEDILKKALSEMSNNETDSGAKIYEESDSDYEKSLKLTNFAWKILQSGTYTSGEKILKSDDPKNEILGQLTGYKIHKIDVKKNLYFKLKELKKYEQSAMDKYGKANTDFENGKIDKEDRDKIQAQAQKSADKTYNEMREYLKAASYFGAKDYEIDEAFEKNGISSYVIKTLWANEMPVID